MSQFRAKRLDLGGFINTRIIRDHTKRKVFEQNEPERYVLPNNLTHGITARDTGIDFLKVIPQYKIVMLIDVFNARQALRYVAQNTTLPQRMRAQAQLKLSQMHCYTRSTQIKNRCTAGGVARGVFRAFRLGRVCPPLSITIASSATSVLRL